MVRTSPLVAVVTGWRKTSFVLKPQVWKSLELGTIHMIGNPFLWLKVQMGNTVYYWATHLIGYKSQKKSWNSFWYLMPWLIFYCDQRIIVCYIPEEFTMLISVDLTAMYHCQNSQEIFSVGCIFILAIKSVIQNNDAFHRGKWQQDRVGQRQTGS